MLSLAIERLVVRFAGQKEPLLSIPRWRVRPSERVCIVEHWRKNHPPAGSEAG